MPLAGPPHALCSLLVLWRTEDQDLGFVLLVLQEEVVAAHDPRRLHAAVPGPTPGMCLPREVGSGAVLCVARLGLSSAGKCWFVVHGFLSK